MSRPRGADGPSRMAGLARSTRPRHWVKNLACLAGLVFSGRLTRGRALAEALAATAAFCLAASAAYLLNDALDRDRDRLDPAKRDRPVASGQVPVGWALAASTGLALAALAAAAGLGPACLGVMAAYLVLTVAYSAGLKHRALVDVLVLALGFVLRVLFGVYAVEARPTPWVILCMFFLALFLGLAKRRHELARALVDGPDPDFGRRPALRGYHPTRLDRLLGLAATLAILCYAAYAVAGRPDQPMMAATVPIVLIGVTRYLYLVLVHGQGGSPEALLVTDPILVATAAAWLLACIAILYLPQVTLFRH